MTLKGSMQRILILAYGNPLRGDDGIGWHVADRLRTRLTQEEVEILSVHQLTPDMAERIHLTDAVIFIDAATSGVPGEIHCATLVACSSRARFSHELSPAAVLGLARDLYGATPHAHLLTVTGESFAHGSALSAPVAGAIPRLLTEVERLAREFLSARPKAPEAVAQYSAHAADS